MDIETALAKGSMDRVERREPEKIYHKMLSAGLAGADALFCFCHNIYPIWNAGIHQPERGLARLLQSTRR